ncbi:MAG: spore germination protein [Clostridia bacterium]|nr:spore germination protein [Clostridia bacterium]
MEKLTFENAVQTVKNAFEQCADFNSRNIIYCGGKKGVLFNIGSYTDRGYISDSIMLPIIRLKKIPQTSQDVFGVICSSELMTLTGTKDAIDKLLLGFAVLFLELEQGFEMFGCMVKRTGQRSVNEPDSEVVVRGPREGFIENSEDNLALLRKRLKTSGFKSIRLSVGEYTSTTIYICYLEELANSDTVNRIKSCIENIKIPSVLDSGYIEHYLKKSSPSLLPNVGNSEKPDVVAAKLLEGRVGIICEGSPTVLTAPYLFVEALQSAEDYLKTPYYATFMRVLRFLSVIIALYLPAFYLSTVEHHTSVLPYKLYKTVIELRQDVPFGVFGELMVILIIFELIREVGIRMPRAVGSAVGIVAGLILGDAAISAGLASAPVIMVASLTAVCTFIVPPFMNSMVLIRFINIFLARIFGFPGIVLSICFILSAICRKESFGVPYFMPISPIKPQSLNDTLTVLPKKALNHVKSSLYNKNEED